MGRTERALVVLGFVTSRSGVLAFGGKKQTGANDRDAAPPPLPRERGHWHQPNALDPNHRHAAPSSLRGVVGPIRGTGAVQRGELQLLMEALGPVAQFDVGPVGQRRLRLEELREEVVEQERGATDGDAARCARGHALAGPRASSRW